LIDHYSLGRHFVQSRAAKLLSLRFFHYLTCSLHVFYSFGTVLSRLSSGSDRWLPLTPCTCIRNSYFQVYFFIHGLLLAKKVQTSGCFFAGILAVKLDVSVFANSFFITLYALIHVNCLDELNALQGVQTSGCRFGLHSFLLSQSRVGLFRHGLQSSWFFV